MAFTTRLSLLSRIGKGDDIGWYDFYRTYRPLILLRGSDHSLTESEKEELVQEVLLSVFKGSKRFHYDSSKGRFRSFLRTIIDRRVVDILRLRRNAVIDNSQEILDRLPDTEDSELDKKWDAEWKQLSLTQAVAELRCRIEPVTYQAFELYVLKEWAPAKVAAFLDLHVGSVYVAKNRAVEHLREILNEQENL